MARPLRSEFPGALYRITSLGNRREVIYDDDVNRKAFFDVLAACVEQFNWIRHAYWLMPNYYHLLIETMDGNLSKGMRQLNGVYIQVSNQGHGRSGHLFQRRFKGILVDKEPYLWELSHYIVLNPVGAGMVKHPKDWEWGSYRPIMGMSTVPPCLDVQGILGQFAKGRKTSQARYERFVLEGKGVRVWENLHQQIYLGDDAFIEKVQRNGEIKGDVLTIPRSQRQLPAPPLSVIASENPDRNAAIGVAYKTGSYNYAKIAAHFGTHSSTVGRIVSQVFQH